jgi:hypothetical protein
VVDVEEQPRRGSRSSDAGDPNPTRARVTAGGAQERESRAMAAGIRMSGSARDGRGRSGGSRRRRSHVCVIERNRERERGSCGACVLFDLTQPTD